MTRPDLLALSPDDLAALANRGLVKRAQKEVEAGDLSADWNEAEDGTVSAIWSDGITSTLPGGKTVRDAKCTCGALELCRHVLRTILAWQLRQSASSDQPEITAAEPWDPGRITDVALEAQVSKTVRDRAALLWSQGVLAELLRSAKPSARFHSPGHTVRFPVPDDLRYTQCSCADPAPCAHAVLAVRAFRYLPPEQTSGIVSEGAQEISFPEDALVAAENCVRELITDGFTSLPTSWRDRLHRVSSECAAHSLMWPAQILEELAADYEQYTARDAGFSPDKSVERAGELLLRLDAIRTERVPVPQAFIRGLRSDRDSDLGPSRFIGLGASVLENRRSTTVTVFLQDSDNGHILTLIRDFAEAADSPSPRRTYQQLARATAVKDASLASLAAGQLISQGGRRTAAGKLIIGRARAVVNPQNFAWEQLKAPVLVEDFEELTARLRLLPPASFRPRRAAADFHVCPLDSVDHAAFDPGTNSIVAVVRDRSGNQAVLHHPWTERGQAGAESLLAALNSGAKPLFVAGHVRASGETLIIHPTAVVLAGETGTRSAVMPYLDVSALSQPTTTKQEPLGSPRAISSRYAVAEELASDLILNGIRRTSARHWPGWQRGLTEMEERGYHRIAAVMREVKASADTSTAALGMLKLLTLARNVTA